MGVGGGGGGRLSKSPIPDLFETKMSYSLSFSDDKLPISESELLKNLSKTSSVLYYIPLNMILVIFGVCEIYLDLYLFLYKDLSNIKDA